MNIKRVLKHQQQDFKILIYNIRSLISKVIIFVSFLKMSNYTERLLDAIKKAYPSICKDEILELKRLTESEQPLRQIVVWIARYAVIKQSRITIIWKFINFLSQSADAIKSNPDHQFFRLWFEITITQQLSLAINIQIIPKLYDNFLKQEFDFFEEHQSVSLCVTSLIPKLKLEIDDDFANKIEKMIQTQKDYVLYIETINSRHKSVPQKVSISQKEKQEKFIKKKQIMNKEIIINKITAPPTTIVNIHEIPKDQLQFYNKLKEFINELISSQIEPDKQRQAIWLKINQLYYIQAFKKIKQKLKFIINQCLKLQMYEKHCHLIRISSTLAEEGIKMLKNYFIFEEKTAQFCKNTISFQNYGEFCFDLTKLYPNSVYWSTFQHGSMYQNLVRCKGKDCQIFITNFSANNVNLKEGISSLSFYPLLGAILSVPFEIEERIILFLLKQAIIQRLNFDEKIQACSNSYKMMFLERGVGQQSLCELLNVVSIWIRPQEDNLNIFQVIDLKQQRIFPLNISKEMQQTLICLMNDQEEHEDIDISDVENMLTVTSTRKQFYCTFTNIRTKCEGLLRYLYKIPQNKKISWYYIDLKWRVHHFTEEQSAYATQKIISKQSFFIYLKNINLKLFISGEGYEVRGVDRENAMNQEGKIGSINWLPSYKNTQKKYVYKQIHKFINNTPKLFSTPPQSVSIQLSHIIYRNFGYLSNYFNIYESKYQVKQNDIICCDPIINTYLEKFKEQIMYILLQDCIITLPIPTKSLQKSIKIKYYDKPQVIDRMVKKLQEINKDKLNHKYLLFERIGASQINILSINEKYKQYVIEFFKYLKAEIYHALSQLTFTIQLTEDQYMILFHIYSNRDDVKIFNKTANIYDIQTSKAEYQKILNIIHKNIIQLTIDQPQILRSLCDQNPTLLQQNKLTIKQINQYYFILCGQISKCNELILLIKIYKNQQQQKHVRQKIIDYQIATQKFTHAIYNITMDQIISSIKLKTKMFLICKIGKFQSIMNAISQIKQKAQSLKPIITKISQNCYLTQNISSDIINTIYQAMKKYIEKEQDINLQKLQANKFHIFINTKKNQERRNIQFQINNLRKLLQDYVLVSGRYQLKWIIQLYSLPINKISIDDKRSRDFVTEFNQMLRINLIKLQPQIQKDLQKIKQQNLLRYIKSCNEFFQQPIDLKVLLQIEQQIKKYFNISQKWLKMYEHYFKNIYQETKRKYLIKNQIFIREQKIIKYQQFIINTIKARFFHLTDHTKPKQQIVFQFLTIIKELQILIITFFGVKLAINEHLITSYKTIQKNKIIRIQMDRGAGKSTILPIFLSALNNKRVLVTQPYDLQCFTIYRRVLSIYENASIGLITKTQNKCKSDNQIIYITLEVLKQILLNNNQSLKQIDILILDQFHQNSVNILIVLMLIPDFLALNPNLKIILTSGSKDQHLNRILDESFKCQTIDLLTNNLFNGHRIDDCLLNKVSQLSENLKMNEQIIVIMQSVDEIFKAIGIFQKRNKKKAYSLYQNQDVQTQLQIIKDYQIIFATSFIQTSLYLPNLKYLVDCRKIQVQKFNQKVLSTQTHLIKVSKSSITQRINILTKPYSNNYYYVDQINQLETQIHNFQAMDLTNLVFQLLVKYSNFTEVQKRIKFVIKNKIDQKLNYSLNILKQYDILDENLVISNQIKQGMVKYGNLGNYQHNYALFYSQKKGCLLNMIVIISFVKQGLSISKQLMNCIPRNKYQSSGDIQSIANYLIELCKELNIINFNQNQITQQVFKNNKILYHRPLANILVNILKQIKTLSNKVLCVTESNKWDSVMEVLLSTYRNCLYLNKKILRGKKTVFVKFYPTVYEMQDQHNNQMQYYINPSSLLFSNRRQQDFIFSFDEKICVQQIPTLNINTSVDISLLKEKISILFRLNGSKRYDKFIFQDQEKLLKEQIQLLSAYQKSEIQFKIVNQRQVRISGKIGPIIEFLSNFQAKRNKNIILQTNQLLLLAIEKFFRKQQYCQESQKIKSQFIINSYKNINKKELFSYIKSDIFQGFIYKLKPNNIIELNKINWQNFKRVFTYVQNFLDWFVENSIITPQDPQFQIIQIIRQPNPQKIGIQVSQHIYQRINQIVSPNLEQDLIKQMLKGLNKKRNRRMSKIIGISWVLVNLFNCLLYGEFVRDWIINGKQIQKPEYPIEYYYKLQQLERQQLKKQLDHKKMKGCITFELSKNEIFDQFLLIKFFQKMGMNVKIILNSWQKLIVFDTMNKQQFILVSLIEGFSHFGTIIPTFDIDVMFLKKNHLKEIGMRVPLSLATINSEGRQIEQKSLQDLIHQCQEHKMIILKPGTQKYLIKDLIEKEWRIQIQKFYQPVCKSFKTVIFKDSLHNLQRICNNFGQMMRRHKRKITHIQYLANQAWNSAYIASLNWILNQTTNTNEKILFHGTSEEGIVGVCQSGFDSRYFRGGIYGRGAYFADDIAKALQYAKPNSKNQFGLFIVLVALGNQQEVNNSRGPPGVLPGSPFVPPLNPLLGLKSNRLHGPQRGFHSILGRGNHNEFIIEKQGQAKPLYLIKFR